MQETRRPPTGDWQETFRKPPRHGKLTGHPRETDRKPTGNLQETRSKLKGKLQETCRKLTGIPLETCRKPARNLQETRRKTTVRNTIDQERTMHADVQNARSRIINPERNHKEICGNSSMKSTEYEHIPAETHSIRASKQNQRQGYLWKPKAAWRKP